MQHKILDQENHRYLKLKIIFNKGGKQKNEFSKIVSRKQKFGVGVQKKVVKYIASRRLT